jgi:uncharacterized membrane protein YfcA
MTISLIALLLLAGAAAGTFGAVLGLGGGILVVPILVLAADVPMHSAVATSLLCVIATSSGAAGKNIERGFANVRLGVTLELWTVIGAIVGGTLAGALSGSVLTAIFAAALLAIAIPMARGHSDASLDAAAAAEPPSGFAASMRSVYFDPGRDGEVRYEPKRLPLAMGISSFAGVLSGLLGIGGGLIIVPALVKLCGIPMKAAAATSNFMIGVTGVASALIYYGRGDLSPLIAAATALGVFAGSRAGAALAGHLDPTHTRRAFAVVMILIAIQMILKAAGWWFV